MGRNELNDSLINDQWNSSKRNLNESMINDDIRKGLERRAMAIADRLAEKFQAPNSYKFFLKCGFRMSEADIWNIYEIAHKPKVNSPIKFFVASCARRPEMQD